MFFSQNVLRIQIFVSSLSSFPPHGVFQSKCFKSSDFCIKPFFISSSWCSHTFFKVFLTTILLKIWLKFSNSKKSQWCVQIKSRRKSCFLSTFLLKTSHFSFFFLQVLLEIMRTRYRQFTKVTMNTKLSRNHRNKKVCKKRKYNPHLLSK